MINNYFQKGEGVGRKSEQDLVETNIIEMIQLAGTDFYWMPRALINVDKIFNEDPLSQFNDYKTIEMYINNSQSFGGQGHLLTQLGLDVNDSIELVVSKKRFFDETGLDIPNEGDLLYWPLTRSLWQITFIEDEAQPMYTLSNIYSFIVKATRYTYSYEEFNTGVPNIDEVNNYTTPFAKNTDINNEANDILDFTESNPFGFITEENE